MTVQFELDGQDFVALNGGPTFKVTEAISLVVNCESQDEIDHFWQKLSAGGQEVECGWLKGRSSTWPRCGRPTRGGDRGAGGQALPLA